MKSVGTYRKDHLYFGAPSSHQAHTRKLLIGSTHAKILIRDEMGMLGLLSMSSSFAANMFPPYKHLPSCPFTSSHREGLLLLPPISASLHPISNLSCALPAFLKPELPSLQLPVGLQVSPVPLIHEHVGHDLLCTLAVFCCSFVWIRFFDLLVRKNILEQKLSRKLVHISTGILYALLWPLFSASPWSRYFALAIPLANALRLLVYGLGIVKDQAVVNSISRSGSSRELLGGPFYYVLVLSICTGFFWRDSPVGMVALAIMCGGDGIADILGRRLGRRKLPYNSSKSWVGSISMFLFSFALSTSFLYYYSSLGFYHLEWSSAVKIVAWISLAATIVESLPISSQVDDNMSVPFVSVLLGSVLFPSVVL